MRAEFSYSDVLEAINAMPNTPAGIRVMGRFVDVMNRAHWPVTIDLNQYEQATLDAALAATRGIKDAVPELPDTGWAAHVLRSVGFPVGDPS